MEQIIYHKEKDYPLYSATLEGDAYDGDTRYEMVIITKWTDRTAKAKELSRKVFYFTPDREYLVDKIKREEWCKDIFENYKQYSVVRVERKFKLYVED